MAEDPDQAQEIARRVRIRGRVQGVFFRDSVQQRASQAGVCGWIRNCEDGSVEAVVQGAPGAVAGVIEYCRHGPPSARVDDVEVSGAEPKPRGGFEVR